MTGAAADLRSAVITLGSASTSATWAVWGGLSLLLAVLLIKTLNLVSVSIWCWKYGTAYAAAARRLRAGRSGDITVDLGKLALKHRAPTSLLFDIFPTPFWRDSIRMHYRGFRARQSTQTIELLYRTFSSLPLLAVVTAFSLVASTSAIVATGNNVLWTLGYACALTSVVMMLASTIGSFISVSIIRSLYPIHAGLPRNLTRQSTVTKQVLATLMPSGLLSWWYASFAVAYMQLTDHGFTDHLRERDVTSIHETISVVLVSIFDTLMFAVPGGSLEGTSPETRGLLVAIALLLIGLLVFLVGGVLSLKDEREREPVRQPHPRAVRNPRFNSLVRPIRPPGRVPRHVDRPGRRRDPDTRS